MAADVMLVRIKPFNKNKGNLCRRYTYRGTKFEVDRGWYEIPAWVAEEMKDLRHPSNGNKIFDVATYEGAVEIDEEEAAEEVARPADKPNKPASFRDDRSKPELKSPESETVLDPGPAEEVEPIATPVGDDDAVAKKAAKKKSKKRATSRRRSSSSDDE